MNENTTSRIEDAFYQISKGVFKLFWLLDDLRQEGHDVKVTMQNYGMGLSDVCNVIVDDEIVCGR